MLPSYRLYLLTLLFVFALMLASPTMSIPSFAKEPDGKDVDLPVLIQPSNTQAADSSSKACECASRPLDEVWLVSTRHLGCACVSDDAPTRLQFHRYFEDQGWAQASLDEFLSGDDPSVLTWFYVHGSRVEHSLAVQRGMKVYRRLTACAPYPAIRFVTLSWPTSPEGRPLRDFRNMARRSDTDAYYLASLVNRIHPDVKTSFVGFSYGARVISGAMHLLSGGSMSRLNLADNAPRVRSTVVMWSPALHNYWLTPGSYHGAALSSIDRLLILYNSCDRALNGYHFIFRCKGLKALGSTGLVNGRESFDTYIEQRDVCCYVGSKHAFDSHIKSTYVLDQTRQFVW